MRERRGEGVRRGEGKGLKGGRGDAGWMLGLIKIPGWVGMS